MASSLPAELLQEIFVRFPPDEHVHQVRAGLVCKAWRRVLLADCGSFLRRCHGFHGAPPLLGYFHNHFLGSSPMQFVPMTTSIASPVRMPALDDYGHRWLALDCRHGRVLLLASQTRLMVWDPITGRQLYMSVSCCFVPYKRSNCYAGAVLCAKDGCDHLDCHDGPFHVVVVETNRVGSVSPCVTKYSSLTNEWSAPTSNHINPCSNFLNYYGSSRKQSLVIGDTLYFPIHDGTGILKYDLCTHSLSKIGMPRALTTAILMKTEGGGLGLVTLSDNRVHMWSRQDVTNDTSGGWVEDRVMELGTLLPRHVPNSSCKVVGFAEGTNSVLVNISTRIFMLGLKSKEVRNVGESEVNRLDSILPYMSFYTPRRSNLVWLSLLCTH